MRTGLNRTITAAGAKIRYDAQCKKVLADRQVLAWILKYTTEEFAHMCLSDIYSCIENKPQAKTMYGSESAGSAAEKSVKKSAAELDVKRIDKSPKKSYNIYTNTCESITGISNEDCVPGEGSIYYDIRFQAYLPSQTGIVTILVNLEAQKSFYTGYSLVTRGIFYGARMISSQLDTEFTIPRYDDIKKVYSVWLCMDAPDYIGNAITQYGIEKKDILGSVPTKQQEYDKLSVVTVCLNEKSRTGTTFTEVMNTLLSERLSVAEKKDILENQYHFIMEKPLEQEVTLMCNLSELVWERGVNEGMERGLHEGMERGMKKGLAKGLSKGLSKGLKKGVMQGKQEQAKIVIANMLNHGMADADIMELAGCEAVLIQEVKAKIQTGLPHKGN